MSGVLDALAPCLVLLHLLLLFSCGDAVLTCETDEYCQEAYNSTNTFCLTDTATCSNPYSSGCLWERFRDEVPKRVCNSDDVDETYCVPPEFSEYPELRIHNGNWESSMALSWIYQIVLSELVHVPATVGLSTQDTLVGGFYNRDASVSYSDMAYPFEALDVANRVHDCSTTDEPCVHVLPEVWGGQITEYVPLVQNQTIDPPTANGLIGTSGYHIPAFVARQYPQLGVWYGLQGEENRHLLANLFRRPTSWRDYCEEVSPNNCTTADATALRYPETADEQVMYYSAALYGGYFRATDKNDCTAHPTTCTGHIAFPNCQWSAPNEAQLYWNDFVGLESDGPNDPTGSYSNSQMVEIWVAATATQSPIIMHWYDPEPLKIELFGTEGAFVMVTMPPPSVECLAHRVAVENKCSTNLTDQRGEPEGACGNEVESLSQLVATWVGDQTYDADAADQSPAYDILKNIKFKNLNADSLIRDWMLTQVDRSGNDARQAVCNWVIDNLDSLKNSIPAHYPRVLTERSDYSAWYLFLAQGVGVFVCAMSITCYLLCWLYRGTKTMVFAQPVFLQLILLGFGAVSMGAVLYAFDPSYLSCTMSAWLLTLGNTVELVPVLVKTSAINRLIQSSKKNKRVNISRRVMLMKVAAIVFFVIVYLMAWTIVDPPRARTSRELNRDDNSIVDLDIKCASENISWRLTAFGFETLLLFWAAILAFQSRGVMKQLNESVSLAMMVYSHFLFVCIRGVSSIFQISGSLAASTIATMFSLNYSLDAGFAMAIYVIPKLIQAGNDPNKYKPGVVSSRVSSALSSNEPADDVYDPNDKGHLNILVCTGNLGNAEPKEQSMEQWIPPEGSCDHVTPLDGVTMPFGKFDVIAIGMQEATWTEKSPKISTIRGAVISEDEVLNALEDHHTAALRETIQDVLGDGYSQLIDEQRGQMRLHIWACNKVVNHITHVKISGANTGIGNVLANKGGIVATMTYKKTKISFLTAHLAAHEGDYYYKARCDNVRTILREAKTSSLSSKFDVGMTSHHLFFLGDLNFRIKFGEKSQLEKDVQRAMELINKKDYTGLYLFDELHEGMAESDLLVDYKTLPCHFPPTFKVERAPGFVYKIQRTPSYTDRILYKSSDGLAENLTPLAYEPCQHFTTSDHKPVRGAFSVSTNLSMGNLALKSDVQLVFRKLRCSGLPAMDSDGTSDPYLMFLWDSVEFRSDNVSLMDTLRELWVGTSWPRTKYISSTLNPYWKGQRVNLTLPECELGSEAMLFIAVMNYDAVRKDEFLGAVVVNVKDLVAMSPRNTEKTLSFDRPLTREGKNAGRIKFKVDVARKQHGRRSSLLNFARIGSTFRLGGGNTSKEMAKTTSKELIRTSNTLIKDPSAEMSMKDV